MIHVAFAADENYAPHAAAMIHSLLEHHAAADVAVHFLHGSTLPEEASERLRSMTTAMGAQFHSHEIPEGDVAGLPDMGRISRVMWYRLFLPRLLPDADRALYVDCDTLFMDDPQPLWAMDLSKHALGAVNNVFERGKEGRARTLGLAGPECYFNSGVLLLNLDAWRRENHADRIVSYTRANADRILWPDQDALNVTLAGQWRALHPRWNCQNSFFYYPHAAEVFGRSELGEAISRPGILHFEGGEFAKPWHYLCKHPYRSEYYRHLAATPWPVRPPEGRTVANRFLHLLPMRWLPPLLQTTRRLQRRVERTLQRLVPAK